MDPTTTPDPTTVPNHHAHHPAFSGARGLSFAVLSAAARSDAKLAARLCAVGAEDRVVDVGCGSGGGVRVAARAGARATGVDPAAVMLRVARALPGGRGRARFLDGAAEALPLADASATVVWSLASVHHWPDVEAGVAEAFRVLRPGGRFLAVERRTHAGATGVASHGWTEPQVAAFADLCRAAGFVDLTVATHPSHRRGEVVSVLAYRP